MHRYGAEGGFTLIEILLVLVVMALMAGLLLASISDNPAQQLEREAKRFQLLVDMAVDEALTQGVELSLQFLSPLEGGEQGYQFLQWSYEDRQWLPREDEPFNFHPVSDQISLKLELENTTQSSGSFVESGDASFGLGAVNFSQASQLLLLSSGELTPFILTLKHEQFAEPIRLYSDGVNGVDRQ